MASTTRFARPSAFIRFATLAYGSIVAFASLYPLNIWRAPGTALMWSRLAEWPRYYTWSDVFLNIVAYAPLGLLFTVALRVRLAPIPAATAAMLLAALMSVGLELLQSWVPVRVPSALDVFCNAVGGLLGAWFALVAGETWLLDGPLARWRHRRLLPGARTDAALTVLGLWLFAQLGATLWLFGGGDLRGIVPLPGTVVNYSPAGRAIFEACVTALSLLSIAAIIGSMTSERAAVLLAGVIAFALLLKSFTGWWLHDPGHPLLWVRPGAALGLGVGGALALPLLRAHAPVRASIGLACLLGSVALLNAVSDSAYLTEGMRTWRHGHYWSFKGTTALVSLTWPLLAALFLVVARHSTARTQPS